ncbi:hypothetical protein QYE80_08245 [Pseudomonas tohonis]|nr:hypothetical protein L682_27165 [Pseudomonas alcaligenes OT 69]MDN4144965.1 hypothetical protein [Pseudomonas tohonis]
MSVLIVANHAPGLMLAEQLVAGATSKDQASALLQAASDHAQAIRLAEASYCAAGFCGDPYVHDCGRAHCQTSDSFVSPQSALTWPVFDIDNHLGPNAINLALQPYPIELHSALCAGHAEPLSKRQGGRRSE